MTFANDPVFFSHHTFEIAFRQLRVF